MRYLLTFKPLKHFFFGNNKTFSDDYLAISEYFPQNTQLFGALRLFIAEQNGLMKQYQKGKWCNKPKQLLALTGSAKKENFMHNDDLGKINNLSQMFIVTKALDDAYFPTPFDLKIMRDRKKDRVALNYYELDHIDEQYFLKNYNVKDISPQMLGNRNFWDAYLNNKTQVIDGVKSYSDIFIHHSQVGIELDNKRAVDEKFYTKIDYQLNKQFLFGCVIDIAEDIIDNGIIQIGAESSLFELQVHNLEESSLNNHPIIANFFTTPKSDGKVVCMSDTILSEKGEFNAYFTIAPHPKYFAMLDKTKSKFNGKTKQKRVLPAGSVSFIKDGSIQTSHIGAYAKMGYNQFITVK